MNVETEQVSSTEKKLSFEIPSETVSAKLNSAYRDLQKTVRLPGFRQGKTPRKVLESRFGPRVRADVAHSLINDSFREAAEEMEFFGEPQVEEAAEVTPGEAFAFSITIEVKPEITLSKVTGVEVEVEASTVDDHAVDHAIEHRLQSQASIAEVEEDRTLEETDMAMIEVEITIDDAVVHTHPGTVVNLAHDHYYGGIAPLLVGVKKGGEFTGEITFADDSQIPEIAGKTGQVKGKVTSIQAISTPELSDDVARELGYEGGMEGMKTTIREELEDQARKTAEGQAKSSLLEKLIELNPFDAPKGLVAHQMKTLEHELRMQALYSGQDPRALQFGEEQLTQLQERATFAAKATLLLEAISEAESIKVEEADMEARYQDIADARGQQVEAVRALFQKEEAVRDLELRLLEEKTLDWLMENSTIKGL
jgi:trigger factor